MPEELDIELDDLTHVYRLNGVEVPGCTTVLAAMGASRGFGFLTAEQREFYQSRGHAAHKSVELMVKGTLDKRTMAKEIKPYLIGWERAVNDYGIEVIEFKGEPFVEVPLAHSVFRFGCRPDVIAEVRKMKDSGPIELKATSCHAPATAIQLAAQHLAVRNVMPGIGKLRLGLRLLTKEPYYDLKKYSDPTDEGTWLSMLNVYHWRMKNKLL